MDLVVGSNGAVAFYGETNKLPVNLDPRLGSLAAKDGRFANKTDLLTSKEGANWALRLAITEEYSEVFVNIYLPQGASVIAVSPSNWTILADRKRLVVNFAGSLTSTDELHIRYGLNSAAVRSSCSYALLAMAFVVCLASVLGLRRSWPRVRPKPAVPVPIGRAGIDAILPTLNKRERMILETIVKEGGRVCQRKLKHICGLPKSTLSRVTNKLQRKGLVRKIPVGQTSELRMDETLISNR